MARRLNANLVKKSRSYDVGEIAELFGLHKNTVRQWIKEDGLEPIDGTRPTLIHGTALKAFVQARNAARKRPCGPSELYCVKCRCPQTPDGKYAEATPWSETCVDLRGFCPTCGIVMSLRVRKSDLAHRRVFLDITDAENEPSIGSSGGHSPNCDSDQEG